MKTMKKRTPAQNVYLVISRIVGHVRFRRQIQQERLLYGALKVHQPTDSAARLASLGDEVRAYSSKVR